MGAPSFAFFAKGGSLALGDGGRASSPGWTGAMPVLHRYRKLSESTHGHLQGGADRLDFGVLLQYFVAHFAAPAGLLVSAEGQGSVENVVAVNPHRTGAELGSETMRLLDIARPNSRGQAVNRIVGLRNQFPGIAERNGRNHRSEDLLPHDLHVLVRVHQNGGLDEVSFVAVPASSGDRLGAFGDS